jgi:hypothetical protein
MKSSTDRTVRVLYGDCTGTVRGCTVFLFPRFLGLDSVVGNLVPVGQVFQDTRPIFPCHTIFTRVSHGTYTGLHGFFLGGRTGGNIQRLPRLGRLGQEKPVKSAVFLFRMVVKSRKLLPAGKEAITVEDFLTMSSPLECNDWNHAPRHKYPLRSLRVSWTRDG